MYQVTSRIEVACHKYGQAGTNLRDVPLYDSIGGNVEM